VQFTFDAVRDPALGSPRAGDVGAIADVEVVNDTLVRVRFTHPMPALPTIFAELPIVPEHLLDTVPRARWRGHAFSTAPVGNGPFRFVDRVAGRRWRFARNVEFPAVMGGPPQLQQLVVAVVDEASTKFAGLVSGELDVAGVSPTMASLVRADPTLELLTPPALFSTILAFNTTRPPFDDARVRRAISLCIDRRRIVQAAVAGYASPAGGAIPPGLPLPSTMAESPDTLRADSLLSAAGWQRSAAGMRTRAAQPLSITVLTVGSGDQAVEQLVQADLQARGIRVNIRVVELAAFLATVRATRKDFDVALTGVPGDIALGQLSAMFATTQRGGALDYAGFHAASLDSALERARNAAPPAVASAWRDVDRLLADSMPVAWLYHARGVQGKSRRLEHVVMDLRGELTSVATWTRRDSL
jgi:ABC-type transport system substrate-binding protein